MKSFGTFVSTPRLTFGLEVATPADAGPFMTKTFTRSGPRGVRRARVGSPSPSRKLLRISAILAAGSLVACAQAPAIPHAVDVVEASIAELHSAILEGRTSCKGVVQAHLDRIETYDRSSGLHAITEVNPGALELADSIDRALASGESPGLLFCAPLLVKDNFDTRDLPTTAGSIALAGSLPPEDAFMVTSPRAMIGALSRPRFTAS